MRAEVAAALARMAARDAPPPPAPGPPVPTPRRGPLHTGKPACPDAPKGVCRWCGEPIVLVDQTDYRRARRRYHYGDEHEVGTTNCLTAWTNSTTWDTRHAVRVRERAAHGLVACVDCGIVCEGRDEMDGTDATPWEADHEVPLEDGGPHTLDNLRCRCVPCHRAKTRAENRARADKRRVDKAQATA